jgi:hypothetical protein
VGILCVTADDFRAKWRHEADAMRHRNAIVEGAALCEEMLDDFEAVVVGEADAVLNLQQAAAESGYSADYLGTLVRKGEIPNAGRPNAPRIRRRELPRKANSLRRRDPCIHLDATTPGQIARSVVTSDEGDAR